MLITATQKYSRQAPRKVRLVANAVKDMRLEEAIRQLAVMDRKAAVVILKTVRQAVANATNNHGLKFDDLSLKNILVDQGPTYKRWRAVARGRAHNIQKKTSHIKVELETKDQSQTKSGAKNSKNTKKNAKASS